VDAKHCGSLLPVQVCLDSVAAQLRELGLQSNGEDAAEVRSLRDPRGPTSLDLSIDLR